MNRLLLAGLVIILVLALYAPLLAVEVLPPGGTIPGTIPAEPAPPVRLNTYCPIHALGGFAHVSGAN